MTNDVQDFFRDIAKTKQKMAKQIPETFKAFMACMKKSWSPALLIKSRRS